MHCVDHHVKECTQDVRLEATQFLIHLREKHRINIFDYGQVPERAHLFGP